MMCENNGEEEGTKGAERRAKSVLVCLPGFKMHLAKIRVLLCLQRYTLMHRGTAPWKNSTTICELTQAPG